MSSPFFGTGYKKKKPAQSAPEKQSAAPENTLLPSTNVAVNVMGDLYQGKEEIKILEGNIMVDGFKRGEMPITSGTWIKILKGKKIKNKTLTIVGSHVII